ncbi:MAG: hypothetical protein ABEH77_03055 [Halobacteriaceae archaeon]
MVELAAVVVLAEAVTLALGGVIAHGAYRAYRRTGSPALRAFAAGFVAVTLGGVSGGVLHQVLGTDLLVGVLVRSLLTAAGFAVLAYSLYVRDPGAVSGSRRGHA